MAKTEQYPTGVPGRGGAHLPGMAPERSAEIRRLMCAFDTLNQDPLWVQPIEQDAIRFAEVTPEVDELTVLEQRVDALCRRAAALDGSVPLWQSASLKALAKALAAEMDQPLKPLPLDEAALDGRVAEAPLPTVPPPEVSTWIATMAPGSTVPAADVPPQIAAAALASTVPPPKMPSPIAAEASGSTVPPPEVPPQIVAATPAADPISNDAAPPAHRPRTRRRRVTSVARALLSVGVLLLSAGVLYRSIGHGSEGDRPGPPAAAPLPIEAAPLDQRQKRTEARSGPRNLPPEAASPQTPLVSGSWRAPHEPDLSAAGSSVPATQSVAAATAGKESKHDHAPTTGATAATGTTAVRQVSLAGNARSAQFKLNRVGPSGVAGPLAGASKSAPVIAGSAPKPVGHAQPSVVSSSAHIRPSGVSTALARVSHAAPAPVASVVVRATADAWIAARDPSGAVIFSRLLHAGESWTPPRPGLLLTTGNAGGTELVVNGVAGPPLGPSGAVLRMIPLDPARLKLGRPQPASAVKPLPEPPRFRAARR